MSLVEQFNIGARIRTRTALAVAVTQSSAAAATTQDGITIDRNESGLRRYYSCKACVGGQFLYAASSAHTASIASLNFQHSSDGTSWDNYSTGTVPTADGLRRDLERRRGGHDRGQRRRRHRAVGQPERRAPLHPLSRCRRRRSPTARADRC
jgi:hypothetical protein